MAAAGHLWFDIVYAVRTISSFISIHPDDFSKSGLMARLPDVGMENPDVVPVNEMEVCMMSYAGTKTDCLSTPCGNIVILDESGNRIIFNIENNPFNTDYNLLNGSPEIGNDSQRYINTEHNYSVSVAASSLKNGKKYRIMLIGISLALGDSDEHTTCVSGTGNGYCIAIGAYDPNDIIKDEQAWEYSDRMGYLKQKFYMPPPSYDRSQFYMYDVEMLDDYSGYEFELIDDRCHEISFNVAWIKYEPGKEPDYLAAVELWTI